MIEQTDPASAPAGRRHDHRKCVRQALTAAAQVCAARGVQLTPTRLRVLELVWGSHRAIKAYDILDRLGSEERPAKPPTVYRALDFLIEQGLVHRVDSLNAFVGCMRPGSAHQGQLLICSGCGTVDEIEVEAVAAAIDAAAGSAGFVLLQHTVELRGLCARCRCS